MLDNEQMTGMAHVGGTELPSSETIRLMANRVSVRKYTDQPVPDAMVEAVLRAAFRAPTSSNIQSYSVVVVRDRETLGRLSVVTANQRHVVETPVFLGFCTDMARIEHAMLARGHDIDGNNLEMSLVTSMDAALVGMSASLAAESLGLRGVMIGAVRNDAVATAHILGLPHRVYCVFGLCLGWPDETPPQKPRMPYDAMVHYEHYGALRNSTVMAEAVAHYDGELAAHYRATGRKTSDDSWSHDVDAKFSVKPRDTLRRQLAMRGFDFR